MKTATINEKEYQFVFNANTAELYYQVFGEDLIELTLKLKEDKTLFHKRGRLQKLAFITNMQASKSIKELSNRLTMSMYFEWCEQFDAGAFIAGSAANDAILTGWVESFASTATEKNQISPQ